MLTFSGHPISPPQFSVGVHVAQSLVFCGLFSRPRKSALFDMSLFFFAIYCLCPSIYGFWMPIWYLKFFHKSLFAFPYNLTVTVA
jgi:hypothetical protein